MFQHRWMSVVIVLILLTTGASVVTAQILGCFGLRRSAAQAPIVVGQEKEPKKGPPAPPPEIFENAKKYMEAYNRHDVKALIELFTEDCVIIDADGETLNGRKELEQDFKDDFAETPLSKISLDLQDIRLLSSDVAVELGKTTFFPDGKTATRVTQYEAIHVKVGERWLVSRVRSFDPESLTPYDHLRDLQWMIGDWIDEAPDSIVQSTYSWDENKAFLIHRFIVKIKGQKVLQGTERIGWDPISKQFRSWIFDSEGGFGERHWKYVDDAWVITSTGTRPDGDTMTATIQITHISDDRMRIASVDRIVGDERMPNQIVIAVRKPPEPKK